MTLALLFAVGAQGVQAQQGANPDSAARVGSPRATLVKPGDLLVVAGITGAVLAVMPADRSIQRSFQRSGAQRNSGLRHLSDVTGVLGDPGSVIISAGLYFAGLGLHSRRTAALGMHTGESVVLGGLLSEGLKGEIGRARPKFSPNDSRLFRTGKGFSSDDFASLPSTETTVAFAAAAALSRGINRDWPGHSRIVTPAVYTGATLVGYSRLYKNAHWASDIVAGAGLGIISAVFVDRFNARYPENIFEKWFLPTSLVPKRNGFSLGWSR